MNAFAVISLFVMASLVTACAYHNEQDLYGACNTPATVSYSQDVAPIIEINCLVCHSEAIKQAGVVLEGYGRISNYTNNGILEGVINHLNGYKAMPKNANQLPGCTLEIINQWLDDGAPNN